MICPNGWRNSLNMLWTKKLLPKVEHPKAFLVNRFIWNPRQKWYRASTAFLLSSRTTEIAMSARRPQLQGPCSNQVPRAENFGDLITPDHNVLNEEFQSRNNHRCAVVVQDLATPMIAIISVQNQNFLGNGKELAKVTRADSQAESYFF